MNLQQYIIEHLLIEGGAGGHMLYPFELPFIKTGNDLIKLYNSSIEYLKNSPADIKIDGINISIKLIDTPKGKEFALDRGSRRDEDARGVTIDQLADRFPLGHGMIKMAGVVLNIFNSSINNTQEELKKLGLWTNSNLLLNIEYVENNVNVTSYEKNFIAIHNLRSIERIENKVNTKEVSYDKKTLLNYINIVNEYSQKYNFDIVGSIPAIFKGNVDLNKILSQKVKIHCNDEIKEYELNSIRNMVIPSVDDNYKTKDGKYISSFNKNLCNDVIYNEANIFDIIKEADYDNIIKGILINLFIIESGEEILKHMSSKLGLGNDQEGIIIRDPSISETPFKIVGKFVLRSLKSKYKK